MRKKKKSAGTWYLATDGQRFVTRMEPADPALRVLGWAQKSSLGADKLVVRVTISIDSEGRPIVSSLHIDSTTEATVGITSSHLRAITLGELLDQVGGEISALKDLRWRAIRGDTAEIGALIDESHPTRRPRSSNRIPEVQLRRVAELYLAEQGGGPGLRKRMLDRLQMPPSAEPTIRYWIQRARAEQWLSAAQHGARGAVPGQRLIEYRESKNARRKGGQS